VSVQPVTPPGDRPFRDRLTTGPQSARLGAPETVTAPDSIDLRPAVVWEDLPTETAILASYRTQVDRLTRERDDARKAFATLYGTFSQGKQSGWSARVSGTILHRLCVAAMCEPPDGSEKPADVRPRDGEPGFCDVTCGECGEEFGTNFTAEEIECPECEARRCPDCRTWFGAQS
jgi:hypothetical protein